MGQKSGCSIPVLPFEGVKGGEKGDKGTCGGNPEPEEDKEAGRGMNPALIWRHRTGIAEQIWGWTGLDWASAALRSGWHRAAAGSVTAAVA